MITDCGDELPNPHKDCLRELLSALIIHDNDIVRINSEIRELKEELKCAIEKLELKCDNLQKTPGGDEKVMDFTKHVAKIDNLNECFQVRIKKLMKNRDEKLADAKAAYKQLNAEKLKIKSFHEKTMEYLKKLAITAEEPEVVRNCEKDIAELHKRFVKEVTFIKRSENELKAFFRILKADDDGNLCDCCCFKDYDWVPKGKDVSEVEDYINEIKTLMGKTLVSALSRMHIHQPADPRMFLAGYLMNIIRNEKLIEDKLQMFEPRDIQT